MPHIRGVLRDNTGNALDGYKVVATQYQYDPPGTLVRPSDITTNKGEFKLDIQHHNSAWFWDLVVKQPQPDGTWTEVVVEPNRIWLDEHPNGAKKDTLELSVWTPDVANINPVVNTPVFQDQLSNLGRLLTQAYGVHQDLRRMLGLDVQYPEPQPVPDDVACTTCSNRYYTPGTPYYMNYAAYVQCVNGPPHCT